MSDIGLAALDKVHEILLIDEEWTHRQHRAFSWIAHRLEQKINASKLWKDDDLELCRLTASCEVVREVAAPESHVLSILSKANRHALGSAYTYSGEDRTITAHTIAYIHEATFEQRVKQLSGYAILQLGTVESEAQWLADQCVGKVATRSHSTNGVRNDVDDMLNVLEDVYAQKGVFGSRFRNKFEMETIAEITHKSPYAASLGGDVDGVNIDVSFDKSTSLSQLLSKEPHRRLGNGLTVRLNLPLPVVHDQADQLVATLNRMEAKGEADTTHFGAWCWNEWPEIGTTIAYQGFVPNIEYRPGVAQDFCYSTVKRARWVDRALNGKSSKVSVWQSLSERFKFSKSDDTR